MQPRRPARKPLSCREAADGRAGSSSSPSACSSPHSPPRTAVLIIIVVAVDVTLTPELAREGLARDLVRRVQTLRKEADYQLDDRIVIYYDATDEPKAVLEEWADYIRAETLSLELVPGPVPGDVDRQESLVLGGQPLALGVKRA